MLKVAVHHGKDIGGTGSHAFEAGGGEAAAPDAADETNARIRARERHQGLARAILRVVIDKIDFPVVAGQEFFEPFDDKRDVVALVVGGDDDGVKKFLE